MKKTIKKLNPSTLLKAGLFVMIFLSANTFMQAQKKLDSVKVFAHRGGKLEFDENTVAAFEAVYKKGLRGFETDIRLTKDNQLVIFHDADLKRIFNKEGSIEQMTLKELKALRTKQGNTIPTLDEALKFFNSKPGLYVEFEMKTQHPEYAQEVVEKYVDAIHAKVYANKPKNSDYLLTSFDKRPLKYIKAKYPEVPMLFIKGEGLSQKLLDEAKELKINRIGCRVESTTRSMVAAAKKQGFIISLWPGLSVDDFLLGVQLGADYLCTDVPVAVYEWAKTKGSWIHLK